jgi:hypothetical protein
VVWDGESGAVTSRAEGSDLCVCALTVTPKGTTAAVATGWPGWDRAGEPAPPAVLRLIRTDGRRADTLIATDPSGADPFVLLAVQPGNGVLTAVSHRQRDTLTAFFLPDGTPAWKAKSPGTFAGLAFHPNGDRLATVTEPGGVTVYDVISGAEAIHLPGPGDGLDPLPLGPRVAFSPDGRSLAAGFRSGLMVWQGSANPDADRAAWRAAAAKRVRAATTPSRPN